MENKEWLAIKGQHTGIFSVMELFCMYGGQYTSMPLSKSTGLCRHQTYLYPNSKNPYVTFEFNCITNIYEKGSGGGEKAKVSKFGKQCFDWMLESYKQKEPYIKKKGTINQYYSR